MIATKMIRSLPLFLLITAPGFAQLGGPVLGYVPSGSAIRPMYGLPAAGAIGPALNPGRNFAQIAISPLQNFAVVSTADSGQVMILKPGASLTAVTGASANPDLLAVSPSGTSAALWFPALGHLQVLTGLPDSPSVSTVDASFLNASPVALAVSDDGQWTAGLWSAGVYAFGSNAQVIPLQTDPGVAALAFFHHNHNLALASASRATSINDVGGASQTSILFDYSAQSLSPKALAMSFDNQRAVVADASGKLVNITVSDASANILDCGCSPTGLYGLGDALFRLNNSERSGVPHNGHSTDLKIFDAAAGSVWIVPPALNLTGARQ